MLIRAAKVNVVSRKIRSNPEDLHGGLQETMATELYCIPIMSFSIKEIWKKLLVVALKEFLLLVQWKKHRFSI